MGSFGHFPAIQGRIKAQASYSMTQGLAVLGPRSEEN